MKRGTAPVALVARNRTLRSANAASSISAASIARTNEVKDDIISRINAMRPAELFTACLVHGLCTFQWAQKHLGAGEIITNDKQRFIVDIDLSGNMFMSGLCSAWLHRLLIAELAA